MGFRNPITTAKAVDTRGGGAAGVRLYQDTSVPGVPAGIAEWATGRMARNAKITLSGGGSGGSSYLIDGGYAGVGPPAPTLGLNVESAAAGGYESVLRVGNNPRLDLGTGHRDAAFTFPAGWANLVPTTFQPLRFRQGADGEIHAEGLVAANVGPYASGWIVAVVTDSWALPSLRVNAPAYCVGGQFWMGLYLNPAGQLVMDQSYPGWPPANSGLHLNFRYWPVGY